MTQITADSWERELQSYPEAHLLQTVAWGRLKSDFGWEASYIWLGGNASQLVGAQVLFRRLPLGWRMAYIPKGPVGWKPCQPNSAQAWQDFTSMLDDLCRKMKTVLVIIEPDLWNEELSAPPPGFRNAIQSIQPPRTILVDLSGGEETILSRMKQKTRYNIRLAQKKGITVRPASDIGQFYDLMTVTGQRDKFGVHSRVYYQQTYQIFSERQECQLLIASLEDQPLAGLMVFAHGQRAWYFYGASSDEHRELMPTYLLQWEAMRWAVQQGCTTYDLWGVPDADEQVLESDFAQRSDGLWGVYRFKRGFGGVLKRSAGPFERVYEPALYQLYRLALRLRNGAGE